MERGELWKEFVLSVENQETSTVHRKRSDPFIGYEFCENCKFKYFSPREKCVKCGKEKPATARTKSGEAVCSSCHQNSKTGTCFKCGGENKVIQGHGWCRRCYMRWWRFANKIRMAMEAMP